MSLSAIWGSSFLFIKLSIQTIPPTLLTFYRLLIASIVLLGFCKINLNNFKKNFTSILIVAIFGNLIPFNLISWSELYVDSVVASTLIGTMPMFTYLLTLLILKNESFSYFKLSGLFICFLGLIVFIDVDSSEFVNSSFIYSFTILFSSFCYAISANCVKRIQNQSAIEIASTSSCLAAVLTFPVMLFSFHLSDLNLSQYIEIVTFKSLISATILGVICTALAIIVFFKIIQMKSPVYASQSNYLIPVFGFIWSFIFLEEQLTSNLLFGLVLIVVGGYLLNFTKKN